MSKSLHDSHIRVRQAIHKLQRLSAESGLNGSFCVDTPIAQKAITVLRENGLISSANIYDAVLHQRMQEIGIKETEIWDFDVDIGSCPGNITANEIKELGTREELR